MTKDLDKKVAHAMELHYERGFIDGMQKQMQSSVDKAVNRMAQTQEPVAWMFQHDETGRMNYVSNDGIHNPTMFLEMNPRYALVCPLYTTPPQRTEQEPPKYSFKAHWEKDGRIGVVAAIVRSDGGVHILEDIIDMPQRTWVGLTDEEIDVLHMEVKVRLMGTFDTKDIYRVVEAKLKEKNT